ncbi:hypothetical protein D3C81_776170 [compost metagenome]
MPDLRGQTSDQRTMQCLVSSSAELFAEPAAYFVIAGFRRCGLGGFRRLRFALALAGQTRGTVLLATRDLGLGFVVTRRRRRGRTGQQRLQRRCRRLLAPTQFLAQHAQLTMQLAPFTHAQEAEEMPATPIAQLGLGQIFVGLAVAIPQPQHADEFGAAVGEQRMRVVGGGTRFRWALTRVLDAEERSDHQHWTQAILCLRGDQHACQLHVHRQARHLPADRSELAVAIDGAKLGQLLPAIGHGAFVRRFQEREFLDLAQTQLQHAQDHARQRGTADFRIGELRP